MSNNPWYYKINGELIKEKKPFGTGDKVHLHSLDGCYNVIGVELNYFTIMKNREIRKIKWEDFRCLKGFGTSEISQYKKEHKIMHNQITYLYLRSLNMKKILDIRY
jgi:hypothetical protein